MYILVNKKTDVVNFRSSGPIEITPKGILTPIRMADVHEDTHAVFEVPNEAIPEKFIPGLFTYKDGVFTNINEDFHLKLVAPSIEEVVKERDRRLTLGFDYDFQDDRGVHNFGTTDSDMKGWREVTDIANAMVNSGLAGEYINIKTNTGVTYTTAAEWQFILLAAAQYRQPIYQAYFALKAMDPIPYKYTEDSYWSGT